MTAESIRDRFAGSLALSVEDARQVILLRSRTTLMLAITTIALSGFVILAGAGSNAALLVEVPATMALGLLLYADAMRAVLVPNYRLSFRNILRVLAVSVITLGLVVVCGFVLLQLAFHANVRFVALSSLVGNALLVFFGTRFAFACFALRDHGVLGACRRSWALSARPTFLFTLLVVGLYYISWFIVNIGMDPDRPVAVPVLWITLRSLAHFAVLLIGGSFIYVFLARWMLECEALHPSRTTITAR